MVRSCAPVCGVNVIILRSGPVRGHRGRHRNMILIAFVAVRLGMGGL